VDNLEDAGHGAALTLATSIAAATKENRESLAMEDQPRELVLPATEIYI